VAHPSAKSAEEPGPGIDLKELADELQMRGISTPLLIRFPDILTQRIASLNEAFQQAIEEYEYDGGYQGVYPIKVNQDFHVVRKVVRGGAPYDYGLEAGSKPELLAAMAMIGHGGSPNALLICNGYKDEDYVETALLASKLGRTVVLVVEKPSELPMIHRVSERTGISPTIGIRVKLSARGAGRWEQSGGDRSKFGLSSREILDAVEYMRQAGLLDRLQMLHFHLGSQISAIRSVKTALREATRFYVELVRLGAGLRYFDVGGGLAVDYDGSQSNFQSSMNYSLQEYARDVVDGVGEICHEAGIKDPILVTEAGRAVTAHHAVLLVDVLGVNASAPHMPESCPADAEPVVRRLWETQADLTRKNVLETWHDAVDLKEESLQLFNLGHLSLAQRVLAENIFWALSARILKLSRELPSLPEELEGLHRAMADTYFCNFSLFQSLPDSWAVKQLFPVMPIQRLHQKPTRHAVLADITCDSDGQISQFIDPRDVKDTLELHEVGADEHYHLGIFLTGAYQEILGDLHNLFGDTHEVHVSPGADGGYTIDHVVSGDTIEKVLQYVGYEHKGLVAKLRKAAEEAVRAKRMTVEETRHLMRAYKRGLAGYTYLERDEE
jgi:arginine decarboxylase